MNDKMHLTACDQEIIHIPGSIQPHGCLVVFDDEGRLIQVSANAEEWLGSTVDALLGCCASKFFDAALLPSLSAAGDVPVVMTIALQGRTVEATVHRSENRTVVELEPHDQSATDSRELQNILREALSGIRASKSYQELSNVLTHQVRRIGRFDRVMVYRFLEDESGTVVSEDIHEAQEPYIGFRYPASDIPKQARELYTRHWLRTIHDTSYVQMPMVPAIDPPLDMSRCALRSVSPVHVMYLKNMGVTASMSVSLMQGDELWGLICCHHTAAWYGGNDMRMACELIGQMASLQIDKLESAEEQRVRTALAQTMAHFGESMREDDGVHSLSQQTEALLGLFNASGAAIVDESRCTLVGATPSEEKVRAMVAELGLWDKKEPFTTDRLSELLSDPEHDSVLASGLLALPDADATGTLIIWFRPEIQEAVTWAGDPNKPKGSDPRSPRSTFAAWLEMVKHRSYFWSHHDRTTASELRVALIELQVRFLNATLEARVQERTQSLQAAVDDLNGFAYSVSHDLRTPLRAMISQSRILVEEYGTRLDGELTGRLGRIESGALKMSALVDSLIDLARFGRQAIVVQTVDVTALATGVVRTLRETAWSSVKGNVVVAPDLEAKADPNFLGIVLMALFDNAFKYRKKDEDVRIELRLTEDGAFSVRDGGIGFDMKYVGKLFLPFERLHRDEDYPGTGIGLATASRIIERHDGEMWAESVRGEGATFFFRLP